MNQEATNLFTCIGVMFNGVGLVFAGVTLWGLRKQLNALAIG